MPGIDCGRCRGSRASAHSDKRKFVLGGAATRAETDLVPMDQAARSESPRVLLAKRVWCVLGLPVRCGSGEEVHRESSGASSPRIISRRISADLFGERGGTRRTILLGLARGAGTGVEGRPRNSGFASFDQIQRPTKIRTPTGDRPGGGGSRIARGGASLTLGCVMEPFQGSDCGGASWVVERRYPLLLAYGYGVVGGGTPVPAAPRLRLRVKRGCGTSVQATHRTPHPAATLCRRFPDKQTRGGTGRAT
jgi:hypothetical protein